MGALDDHQSLDSPTDRIQLCGRLTATVGGRRVDESLTGGEMRLLLAYLVLHRLSPVDPNELVQALWAQTPPPDASDRVGALLRRPRRLVGRHLELQPYVQLRLNTDTFIDI